MLSVAYGDGSIIFERKIQAINKERARLAKQRDELIKTLNGLNAEINGLDTKADQYIDIQNKLQDTKYELPKRGVNEAVTVKAVEEGWVGGKDGTADDT
jgi:uncharacterized lipoprotein YehR (DUF1307 family)